MLINSAVSTQVHATYLWANDRFQVHNIFEEKKLFRECSLNSSEDVVW